jgi:DNA-binding transcriptional LysR family regulator
VRSVITDLDRSVVDLHDVAHIEAGDVTVGCVFSAVHHFLPGVIRSFREQHPHVLVRIIEEGADEVLASVKSGEADFALNYTGMQDPEVAFTPLLKERFVLACPVGHPLAKRRSVRWEEIVDYPYALVSHASRNRVLIDQALAEVTPLPRPVCEFRHISTLIGFVGQRAGRGHRAAAHAAAPASLGGGRSAGAPGHQPHHRSDAAHRAQPLAGGGGLRAPAHAGQPRHDPARPSAFRRGLTRWPLQRERLSGRRLSGQQAVAFNVRIARPIRTAAE